MDFKVCFLLSAFLLTITYGYYEGFPECPSTWIRYRSYCYKLIKEPSNWFDAVDKCSALKARLIDVENEDELAYVTALAKQSPVSIWLGGNDLFKRGSFTWHSTGKPVIITDWATHQPNGQLKPDEACIRANHADNGQWTDAHCTPWKFYFLCKKMVEICSCRPFE